MEAFYETRDKQLFAGGMFNLPYPLHVHEIVEIVFISSGACRMQIGLEYFDLSVGDLAIAFPFVPHSYDRVTEDLSGFAMFIEPNEIREFSRLFAEKMPVSPVIRAKDVTEEIHRTIDMLWSMPEEQPHPYRLAYAHLLLALMLNILPLEQTDGKTESSIALQIVRYIDKHVLEPLSLKGVAQALNISPSHLSHIISDQLKTNLRRMINGIRIGRAITLMQESHKTLTDICFECGYESTRTFRRAFVAETGMLPADFLKKLRPEGMIT